MQYLYSTSMVSVKCKDHNFSIGQPSRTGLEVQNEKSIPTP